MPAFASFAHPLRPLRIALVLDMVLALVFPALCQAQKPVTQAEVDKITREAILIDTHNDVPSNTIDGYDIGSPNPKAQTNLARMRGFLGAEFFAVFVDAEYVNGNHAANRTLQMIDTVKTDIIHRYPGDFVFATTADDIVRAHNEHKIAALMGIEGGHAIEDSLRLLRDYYTLGVRYMTLTHFNTNDWADAQGDADDPKVHHHGGLTPFGKDVVREIDDHTRNMTDDMIRALAKNGGTIQINFECSYLSQRYNDASKPLMAKLMPRYREAQKIADPAAREAAIAALMKEGASIPPATLQDVVAQIDHAVKIGGIDHVGIGTDFDGSSCVPADLDSYSKFPALTRALLEKGYSADDIKKIYGGNILRVMRAVEQRSRELASTPPLESNVDKKD